MDKQVVIGTIIAPHGVRGDVRILPQTDQPEQFLNLEYFLLEDGRKMQIESARFHKRMILTKIKGITSMNDAELLRGKRVLINSEDLPRLNDGEYYVSDLLGIPVYELNGVQLGTLKEVLSTGSNDVYVIATEGKKDILIPALKKHVKEIDIVNNKILVELPEWIDE